MNKQNLYNADCMDFMKEIPNNYYKLAIADPPYGIGMSKAVGKSQQYSKKELVDKKWDDKAMPKEFFKELERVSENQIVWGANHFIDNIPNPRNSSCWIVWDKREGFIPERTFACGELAWTSFNSPVRVFRHHWDGFLQKIKEKRIHPTQKPVALYEWIILKYHKEGGIIFDPFGGSFSSAIACYKQNIEMDIVELDKEIFELGKERYTIHCQQTTLF